MSDKEELVGAAAGNGSTTTPVNKVAAQLGKMREANTKYKNLLKLAKDRIQQQEDELKRLRGTSIR